MNFFIYPSTTPKFIPQDLCFVLLPKDRHTGRAVVESEVMVAASQAFTPNRHSLPKCRHQIRYLACGSTYHASLSRLHRVYPLSSVLVTGTTQDYRQLAWSQVTKQDDVLELGSSYGLCTDILYQQSNKVIGMDISETMVHKAKEKFPHIEFRCVDVLHLREWEKGWFNKVFVDIGGDRSVEALVRVLEYLMEVVKPELIVVKSKHLHQSLLQEVSAEKENLFKEESVRNETLFESEMVDMNGNIMSLDSQKLKEHHQAKQSKQRIQSIEGYIDNASSWWQHLVQTHSMIPGKQTQPQWFIHAKNKGFTDKPLSYPWRETDQGIPICRLHNYDVCRKKQVCTFDHEHCHACGERGHVAVVCARYG